MVPNFVNPAEGAADRPQNIDYIQQMLIHLSAVAREQGQDLLAYLIDMAFEEAQEILRKSG